VAEFPMFVKSFGNQKYDKILEHELVADAVLANRSPRTVFPDAGKKTGKNYDQCRTDRIPGPVPDPLCRYQQISGQERIVDVGSFTPKLLERISFRLHRNLRR